EDQTDRGATGRDGTEECEGPVASGLVGRARGEECEHARCGEGRADALQSAGRDELARGLGETAEGRAHGEGGQADLEDAEPAEDVAQPTAQEQQAAE